MFSASKKLDYGIMIMASLPEFGSTEFRSLQDVAHKKHLSAGFLGQLMIPLKKARLVQSREGVNGGYQLAKQSKDITLSDIYTALEGPLALTNCLNASQECVCESQCPTKGIWSDLQSIMSDYLSHKTLAEFRSSSLTVL